MNSNCVALDSPLVMASASSSCHWPLALVTASVDEKRGRNLIAAGPGRNTIGVSCNRAESGEQRMRA